MLCIKGGGSHRTGQMQHGAHQKDLVRVHFLHGIQGADGVAVGITGGFVQNNAALIHALLQKPVFHHRGFGVLCPHIAAAEDDLCVRVLFCHFQTTLQSAEHTGRGCSVLFGSLSVNGDDIRDHIRLGLGRIGGVKQGVCLLQHGANSLRCLSVHLFQCSKPFLLALCILQNVHDDGRNAQCVDIGDVSFQNTV